MPLNVKRFGTSCLVVLILVAGIFAQTVEDLMRQRIARARAFVAVKNYNAAVYELDSIRKETKDETVQNVAMTMLINVYLEQGDYRRAQDLLVETYNSAKSSKKPSLAYYSVAGQVIKGSRNQIDRYRQLGLSVADKSLPTEAIADIEKMRETLEMVVTQSEELAIANKQPADSIALLEESTAARSTMARDDFDSSRWKNKIADARERLANSRAKVVNVVEQPIPDPNAIAQNNPPAPQQPPAIIPVSMTTPAKPEKNKKDKKDNKDSKPAANNDQVAGQRPVIVVQNPPAESKPSVEIKPIPSESVAKADPKPAPPIAVREDPKPILEKQPDPVAVSAPKADPLVTPINEAATNGKAKSTPEGNSQAINAEQPAPVNNIPVPAEAKPALEMPAIPSSEPLAIGSLKEYAVRAVQPSYPPIAKNMRMTGIVKIDFTVNEEGAVADIQGSTGPDLLKRAAIDALKKWKFKPFTRDGQPVKAIGFVNFNFAL